MKRFLLILLALMLTAAGISLAESTPATDDRVHYALNEEQTILTVELVGNATTGYEWFCTLSPENLLTLTSNDYVLDEAADADMVGVGGKSVFAFETAMKDAGMATLTFEYKRAWEDEVAITYIMDVWVNEAGLLNVESLRKSPPWEVGDFIDCPECGVERAEVMEVINGGQEGDGTLWGVILECPACGRVEN